MKNWLLAAALAASASSAAYAAQQDAPPPPPAGEMQGYGHGPRGGGMLTRADANSDGVVTREEYLADAGRRFDRLDMNHDGRIDAQEREAMETMRQMHQGRRGMNNGDTPPPPSGQ